MHIRQVAFTLALCVITAVSPTNAFAGESTYRLDTSGFIDVPRGDDIIIKGVGSLVLENYVPGTALTNENFIRFDFSSNVSGPVSLVAEDLFSITGNLSDLPGPDYVLIYTSIGARDVQPVFLDTEGPGSASGLWVSAPP